LPRAPPLSVAGFLVYARVSGRDLDRAFASIFLRTQESNDESS
jgi:hypothetical protein